MEDFKNESRYAVYSTFAVGAEIEKYKLTLGAYSGTAGNYNLCQNISIIETYIILIYLCFDFPLCPTIVCVLYKTKWYMLVQHSFREIGQI